jgi:hypothetical protein
MLTQPSWLVAHSQPEHNDPIRRGKFIRESLLCQKIPEIPIGTIPQLDFDKYPTLREVLAAHVSKPNCKACHMLMDPIGLALEGFDHLGRPQPMEGGKPTNTSGEITAPPDPTLAAPFDGHLQLTQRLVASPAVRACFTRLAFESWLGRAAAAADACTLAEAQAAYDAGDGSLVELLASLMSSRSFLERQEIR